MLVPAADVVLLPVTCVLVEAALLLQERSSPAAAVQLAVNSQASVQASSLSLPSDCAVPVT